MNDVLVYILHTSLVKDKLSFVSSFVDLKRKEKALKYVNEKDQLLSFGAAYLLKRYLPSGDIKISENGKPYLADGPHFNISHSEEYVVLVVHPYKEIGVDIERIDDSKIEAIKFTLSDEEKKISDIYTLFQMWSNKESLIKCMGTGIKDIKKVNALPLEGVRSKGYYTKAMIYDGYSLSITLKSEEPFDVNIYNVEILEE